MPRLQGWIGLGTVADDVFSEFTGYHRPPFHILGSEQPYVGRLERFPAPTGPAGAAITHGALYDSQTTNRCS
jgi:hypothetical protein